jgi:beta-phosphoglucomutase-like phosphatase (HAD superfamily)
MPGKSIKALIFDMDGVLVNTEPHQVFIERKLFQDIIFLTRFMSLHILENRHGLRIKALLMNVLMIFHNLKSYFEI